MKWDGPFAWAGHPKHFAGQKVDQEPVLVHAQACNSDPLLISTKFSKN
jgi:hypothetical protein